MILVNPILPNPDEEFLYNLSLLHLKWLDAEVFLFMCMHGLFFQLNDVAKGGATVFPRLGASVWPSKGSAVFWYNLRRSGKPYLYTVHGGCPVVLGSKWSEYIQWARLESIHCRHVLATKFKNFIE